MSEYVLGVSVTLKIHGTTDFPFTKHRTRPLLNSNQTLYSVIFSTGHLFLMALTTMVLVDGQPIFLIDFSTDQSALSGEVKLY